jgi:hypothetical protein
MSKDCRWLTPVLVGQFEFLEWTGDHHLRHSKFIALREDKNARDVRREEGYPFRSCHTAHGMSVLPFCRMGTLQRAVWDGHPVSLGVGFELRKPKSERELHAVCSL